MGEKIVDHLRALHLLEVKCQMCGARMHFVEYVSNFIGFLKGFGTPSTESGCDGTRITCNI